MRLLIILLLLPTLSWAEPARQDSNSILNTVTQFLQTQSVGLPGKVKITLGKIDDRLNLAPCSNLEAFMPYGSRIWGKTTVGVRCSVPSTWTLFVQADVRVTGNYVISAAPLARGQMLSDEQLSIAVGDLTKLPNGVITSKDQATGKIMTISIPAGTPLRSDAVQTLAAIKQGQNVRIITTGNGFEVSTEGHALNNANAGQPVQIRLINGQVITGIAKPDGSAEISN
ncbi:flagellar basal body P-ring formation chaperone FlgA [Sulfuriferula nivalis]|uniref:Flagella basal body P-ring formation protein FlgA n=1 Tax=Sulfuriferula nivalis TaxID=2675298 RepID=A0A809SEA4_9PROT|nr:flagellar basal body P-ring formation chaperone FlgA [Sulfuriferula nivalis]BBP01247.1 flagellar basal body P-ring biosynthesis protein FlgA [Sulfuriferula nivalis]